MSLEGVYKGCVQSFASILMDQVDASINHRCAKKFMEVHKELPGDWAEKKLCKKIVYWW